MTRILLAGDTHGNFNHTQAVFAHACRQNADFIFQLGDFGFGWGLSQRKVTGEPYDVFTAWVSKLTEKAECPFYWLPGNHENYDFLYQTTGEMASEEDGTFQIEPGVFYVPRGLVLEWGGKRFLCCGGAASVDKKMRVPHRSWWPQELITAEDLKNCHEAGKADILLSHDFPWEVNVVDRHLDPFWGEEAQLNTRTNRMLISNIASWAGIRRVYHGHLHRFYRETIRLNDKPVIVTGLTCDGNPMSESTMLIDTEEL